METTEARDSETAARTYFEPEARGDAGMAICASAAASR
jgi:hypothetical protein